ncbi:MAG: hypothetical protein IJD22_07555 [Clostridia bacterium]|nr:hypothetical protein [Clostridia bacterium]
MGEENALGDILNSLLQSPEIMKTVASVAQGLSSTPSDREENREDSAKEGNAANTDTDNAGISIPPELIARLPQIMSALSGAGRSSHSSHEDTGKDSDRRRKALLLALKPFLSQRRCAMIDGILQLEGLYGILGSLHEGADNLPISGRAP